jgi:hypothetical protein
MMAARRGCCPADVKLEGRRVQEWRRLIHKRTENRGAIIRFFWFRLQQLLKKEHSTDDDKGRFLVTSCE